jgi:hypothetical protein
VVTPRTLRASYTPSFFRVSAAMGTVLLTGLLMMFRIALEAGWSGWVRGAAGCAGEGKGHTDDEASCPGGEPAAKRGGAGREGGVARGARWATRALASVGRNTTCNVINPWRPGPKAGQLHVSSPPGNTCRRPPPGPSQSPH